MVPHGMRPAAVAGAFYPCTRGELSELVESCFRSPLGPGEPPHPQTRPPTRVVGLVSPHAGLIYSGPAAAHGYADLAVDGRPDTVVLLGPNHRGIGAPIALSAAVSWHTPLGMVGVDQEMAEDLLELCPEARYDDLAHAPEHSLEVQLPFLQWLYGSDFCILPILLSLPALTSAGRLASALVEAVRGRSVVFVASSDLSHYLPESEARERDQQALRAMTEVDPSGLARCVQQFGITMCGEGPVCTVLWAARSLGVSSGRLNTYYTSGAVTGDRQSVVGYASVSLIRADGSGTAAKAGE